MVAGNAVLQYSPQPIGYPSFAATEVPTTLADAPMGVALPPISVARDNVQANVERSAPVTEARVLIIGIMVAAKGILSTTALQIADTQRMIRTIR